MSCRAIPCDAMRCDTVDRMCVMINKRVSMMAFRVEGDKKTSLAQMFTGYAGL